MESQHCKWDKLDWDHSLGTGSMEDKCIASAKLCLQTPVCVCAHFKAKPCHSVNVRKLPVCICVTQVPGNQGSHARVDTWGCEHLSFQTPKTIPKTQKQLSIEVSFYFEIETEWIGLWLKQPSPGRKLECSSIERTNSRSLSQLPPTPPKQSKEQMKWQEEGHRFQYTILKVAAITEFGHTHVKSHKQ